MARQEPERRHDQQQGEGRARKYQALHENGGAKQEGRKQQPVETVLSHHPIQGQTHDQRREKQKQDRREHDGLFAENRVEQARGPGKERRRNGIEPPVPGFEKAPRPCEVLCVEACGKPLSLDLERPIEDDVLHLHVLDAFLVGGKARRRENVERARERREDDDEKKIFTGISFHFFRIRVSTAGLDPGVCPPR